MVTARTPSDELIESAVADDLPDRVVVTNPASADKVGDVSEANPGNISVPSGFVSKTLIGIAALVIGAGGGFAGGGLTKGQTTFRNDVQPADVLEAVEALSIETKWMGEVMVRAACGPLETPQARAECERDMFKKRAELEEAARRRRRVDRRGR